MAHKVYGVMFRKKNLIFLIGDGEFLSELSNLLQSADRLDKMMRSDDGQPGRLLDQISKYDSIHDLGLVSTTSFMTENNDS